MSKECEILGQKGTVPEIMIFNEHVLHEHIRITAVVQVTPCKRISTIAIFFLLLIKNQQN
jgi:hypothetical protein